LLAEKHLFVRDLLTQSIRLGVICFEEDEGVCCGAKLTDCSNVAKNWNTEIGILEVERDHIVPVI